MRRTLFALALMLWAVPAWAQQSNTSYADRFRFIPTGCTLRSGTGSPEGVVVGSVCDVYVRKDTSGLSPGLYTKQTGTLTNTGWVAVGGAAGAPTDATYITQTVNGTLTNEQALSALATGLLKNTTTTGVLSIATAGVDYLGVDTITLPNAKKLRIEMVTPAAPVVTQSSAGTLSNGTYKVTLTVVDGAGGETLAPAAVNCVVTATSNDACIGTWTATKGAQTYRLWISDLGGATPNKYWEVTTGTLTKTITSLVMTGVVAGTLPVASTAYEVNVDATTATWHSPFPAGGATAPSVAVGSANTGLYAASNGLGLVANGVEYISIASNGKTWAYGQLFGITGSRLIWGAGQNASAFAMLKTGALTGSSVTNTLEFASAAETATWNDNSSAASSTKASRVLVGIPAPTLTSTAAVTYTDATTWYIGGAPTASTNVTITNTPMALWIDAGKVRFDGDLGDATNTVPNIYAAQYYTGATAGVDCTSASAVTVAKGIVTACSAPDPLLTPQALAAEIAALKLELAQLRALLAGSR